MNLKISCYLNLYWRAMLNDLAVDRAAATEKMNLDIGFTPLRPLRTGFFIRKYRVNKRVYSVLCGVFVFVLPFYYGYRLWGYSRWLRKKPIKQIGGAVALLSSGRAYDVLRKVREIKGAFYLKTDHKTNVDQHENSDRVVSVYCFLSAFDLLVSFCLSLLTIPYCMWRLKRKSDLPQCYSSLEWFAVFFALKRIRERVDVVYHVNHYDRWAVLYDYIFIGSHVHLVQHGLIDERMKLPYELRNLHTIHAINRNYFDAFCALFNLQKVKYKKLPLWIPISDGPESDRQSVLIVGHPHTADTEQILAEILAKKFIVFLKPHPVYGNGIYSESISWRIVKDGNFFPRVDLVVSGESTLGLEYEAAGIAVLYWTGKDPHEFSREVFKSLSGTVHTEL